MAIGRAFRVELRRPCIECGRAENEPDVVAGRDAPAAELGAPGRDPPHRLLGRIEPDDLLDEAWHELGPGTKAALERLVAREPKHDVADRARRRVVSGGDEHHHDPDERLVVERRQLGIPPHEAADDVVAGLAPAPLDELGHVRA